MVGTKTQEPSLEEELRKRERLLTLRGSAAVLKAYLALQRQANTVGLHNPELASCMARLILDMRRDLGVSAVSIHERDLTTLLRGGKVEGPPSPLVQAERHPLSMGNESEAGQTA